MVPQQKPAEQFVFNDELLTVFFWSAQKHDDLRFLAEVDAENFIIVEDQEQVFSKIKTLAERELETLLRLSKDHCQKQLWFVEEQIMCIEEGTFASLLAHHKRAQTLLWWAGLKRGHRRVPKIRVHQTLLGEQVAALYLRALNLEMNVETLKSELKKMWPQILKHRKSAEGEASTRAFKHTTMHQKWRANEMPEGVLALREFFSLSVKKTPKALSAFELYLFSAQGEPMGIVDAQTRRAHIKSACTISADAQNALFEIVK